MGGIVAMSSTINASTASGGGVITTADASGILQLQTGGTTALTIDASQNVGIGRIPTSFKLEIQSGLCCYTTSVQTIFRSHPSDGNGELGTLTAHPQTFITNSIERMRIDSSGNLLVGTTSADAIFQVKGAGSTSATRAIRAINSSSTELLAILNDGSFFTGGAVSSPYNATTATAANVYINSSGQLLRSTSSSRYKNFIQDATYGLKEVLKLRPVTYKGNNDGEKTFGGLIAEEVDAVGLKEFVQYNEQNQPDALHYANMVSLAFKAIQELKAIIDTQNARIEALENN